MEFLIGASIAEVGVYDDDIHDSLHDHENSRVFDESRIPTL